jgi:hypothetical protein
MLRAGSEHLLEPGLSRPVMPPGTLWRRALRRVDRRSAAFLPTPGPRTETLLREAVRLSNRLFFETGDSRVIRP